MLERNGKVYFTFDELACKATKKVQLAKGFGEKLIDLRIAYGRPMIVTSCCRSREHNKNVGGNERSLHVYDSPFWPTGGTCAIDIAITDPARRADLTVHALQTGWWVGFNEKFLHLDRRIDFGIADTIGMFLYGSK